MQPSRHKFVVPSYCLTIMISFDAHWRDLFNDVIFFDDDADWEYIFTIFQITVQMIHRKFTCRFDGLSTNTGRYHSLVWDYGGRFCGLNRALQRLRCVCHIWPTFKRSWGQWWWTPVLVQAVSLHHNIAHWSHIDHGEWLESTRTHRWEVGYLIFLSGVGANRRQLQFFYSLHAFLLEIVSLWYNTL